jgi:hypothetical protein
MTCWQEWKWTHVLWGIAVIRSRQKTFLALLAAIALLGYCVLAPIAFLCVFDLGNTTVVEIAFWLYSPLCHTYKHNQVFAEFYDQTVVIPSGLTAAEWYFVAIASAGKLGG